MVAMHVYRPATETSSSPFHDTSIRRRSWKNGAWYWRRKLERKEVTSHSPNIRTGVLDIKLLEKHC